MASRIQLLDNYTGSAASAEKAVDGTYMIFLDGTFTSVTFEAAQSQGGNFESLLDGQLTSAERQVITLPSCWLRVTPVGATNLTVTLLQLTK